MNPAIELFLNSHYSVGPFHLDRKLHTNGQRLAYQASTPAGRWVVKFTDPGRAEAVVRADVNTPAYLSEQGFPAPRPLAARDGQLYLPYDDRFIYVYAYFPGEHPLPCDRFYTRLGELLARLHALPCAYVPVSDYRPLAALTGVRDYLNRVERSARLPEDQRAILPDLYRLIDSMPSFEGLPRGIIHTDPYYDNLIETLDHQLALIDWEDGGISFPLLDVGFVVGPMCTFTARDRLRWQVPGPEQGLSWRPDWGERFLAAYESIRPLSSAERELLPSAIRFSFLVYIPMWGADEIILDNYVRMQMTAPG